MDLEGVERVGPWLEIDAEQIIWNLAQIRGRVRDTPVMAVVKCNAYGHGAVGVAQVLAKAGVDDFAVVKVSEAVELRDAGIQGRILNFGPFSAPEAEHIVRLGVSQSVFSEAVTGLAEAAGSLAMLAKVHIKVDTGMSRVGVPHEAAVAFIASVDRMPHVEIEGVFTTLTEEPDFDLVQVARLEQVCREAEALGISVGIRHAVSSSGVAESPSTYLDMVRPGNAVYGFEPLPGLDLRPALSLRTRVILLKQLGPGDTLGYHRVREIDEEILLATLPIGYADGYPPTAAETANVLIGGRRWPVIGDVSANHTLVDVTGSDVQEGDEVVLFGTQGDAGIRMAELAEQTGVSVYQLAICLNPLLPRVFIDPPTQDA